MSNDCFKNAKNRDDAWNKQETYEGKPHGWIQWKGTDVCMDVHCKCGQLTHVDAEFAYYIQCCKCGTKYFCNGHIELIEIETVDPDLTVIKTESDQDSIDEIVNIIEDAIERSKN